MNDIDDDPLIVMTKELIDTLHNGIREFSERNCRAMEEDPEQLRTAVVSASVIIALHFLSDFDHEETKTIMSGLTDDLLKAKELEGTE